MKLLKRILIIVAIIIAIPLIIALFTKKDCIVEREVTINKPKQEVFDYIKILKNQNHYSKWVMMDPNVRQEFKGTDGTPGFVAAWDSDVKDVGKGEQEIKAITPGERMDLAIHFIRPFEGRADAWMTTSSVDANQTKVKWGFHSKAPYPFNLMLLFVDMNTMIGNDIQTGLTNLKGVLEK